MSITCFGSDIILTRAIIRDPRFTIIISSLWIRLRGYDRCTAYHKTCSSALGSSTTIHQPTIQILWFMHDNDRTTFWTGLGLFILFASLSLAALQNVTVDGAVVTDTVVPTYPYLPSQPSNWNQSIACLFSMPREARSLRGICSKLHGFSSVRVYLRR